MFGRKNKNVLYRIPERERGHLEAFAAQRAVADASYYGLLQKIIEREKLPLDARFDAKQFVFVNPTK